MDLDEWLWRKKCTRRKMARAIGVHHQTIFNILAKKRTPALFTAIAIERFTNGEVKIEELLNEEDAEKLKKMVST